MFKIADKELKRGETLFANLDVFGEKHKRVLQVDYPYKGKCRVWLLDNEGEQGYWYVDYPAEKMNGVDLVDLYCNVMLKVFGEETLLRFMIDQDRAEVRALFRRIGNDSGKYGIDAKAIGWNNKERYIDES